MKKTALLLYGVLSYGVFLLTFLYVIGFVGDVGVPKSIDSAPTSPLGQALLVNLGLLAVFAVQHSLMARPFFKRWITRFIPESAERSTYVLASSLALIVLIAGWQPMGGTVWSVESGAAAGLIRGVFGLGWLLVLVSTFQINHFDLFGLRQVWLEFRGRTYTPLRFETPWLYRYVRHPLYLGFFLAIWAAPVMTVAHLVFALMCSAYILVGTRLEERDLSAEHPEYPAYASAVPRYLPRLGSYVPRAVGALLLVVLVVAGAFAHAVANVQAYI
jgi:protein-S-isoprenylcysteine O-methyltransferase Ste14